VRVGVVVLPEFSGPQGIRMWRRVEELGVAHAWTLDHLSWRGARGRPWFDSFTLLAAAAAGTERMTLGTLVASPNFRHPVTTATQAMGVDHLSGGRFVLGLGAGVAGPDADALGAKELSAAERADRFEEFVTMLDTLLRQPVTTRHGRYFQAVDVPMVPGCVQTPRVPFAVAATGPRGLRLTAAHADTWVTIGDPRRPGAETGQQALSTLRTQLDRLERACAQVGRDPGSLRRLVHLGRISADPWESPDRLADLTGACAELGFTDVVVDHPRPHEQRPDAMDRFQRAVGAVCAQTIHTQAS
jgi:alkanesulfonate monooxygenase SsuD/methylene tetrahydromethanopterin reductase-like flavin-dependent oxidoreductase (luciferase family)